MRTDGANDEQITPKRDRSRLLSREDTTALTEPNEREYDAFE
jgi:hypothetical protein